MNYYMSENGVIATIGNLDLPRISKEEFDLKMNLSPGGSETPPENPEPDPEQRIAELEAELHATKILLGLEA